MERQEALQKIQEIIGQDLRPLADKYGVTVFRDGFKNKGWAGHVIERHLGLPLNSSRAPNFGSWELKLCSLVARKSGILRVKETVAITMLDPIEVMAKAFEDSHVYQKLNKILLVSRIYEDQLESSSILQGVTEFDLDDPVIFAQVKADYDLIRGTLLAAQPLSGRLGVLIQPRTKGRGHGSTSRAFYARTTFVARILGIVS